MFNQSPDLWGQIIPEVTLYRHSVPFCVTSALYFLSCRRQFPPAMTSVSHTLVSSPLEYRWNLQLLPKRWWRDNHSHDCVTLYTAAWTGRYSCGLWRSKLSHARRSVMHWIFVPPQKFICWNLFPSVTVFGGGFGRWLDHEGGALMSGVSVLTWRGQGTSIMRGCKEKSAACSPEEGTHPAILASWF